MNDSLTYTGRRLPEDVRLSKIELSTKVLDSADRLRDTLIHELCHAAAWIVSGYRDGHGPIWKAYGRKARSAFSELPIIDRCHSYNIRTKFQYKCTRCGYTIGRHSKSLVRSVIKSNISSVSTLYLENSCSALVNCIIF